MQTHFSGLRGMARSGQGLAGMAEELDELTLKILKEEITEGICIKIVDDCYVVVESQVDTSKNYKMNC